MRGFVTLYGGQQALIYSLQGEARVVDGPNRIFLWREKYEILECSSANQKQYLAVKYKTGKVQHIQGPISMFKNPMEHIGINLLSCTALDANEVLVVYQQDLSTQKVNRYLKHGPTIFMPAANEWLHKFKWHGTDPENKTRKLADSLIFTKLKVIPDQFYYNVRDVRTADDALMRVKLMLFYELKNIEHMLNATHDPIADFINCLEADVVAFASKLSYLEFIDQSSKLNELDNYPQLKERCKAIGYEISKVVFRGYHASPVLQSMHDNTIMARNKLKIAFETAEQLQEATDMNLTNELGRLQLEQEMELMNLQHQQEIDKKEREHKLQLKQQEEDEKVKEYKKNQQYDLESQKARNTQQLEHYSKLHDLQVDLNTYISSLNPQPAKVTRVVNGTTSATLHLHQQEAAFVNGAT